MASNAAVQLRGGYEMIIICEQYQDKVYILDANGRIWRITMNFAGEPEINLLPHLLSHDQIKATIKPKIAMFDKGNTYNV